MRVLHAHSGTFTAARGNAVGAGLPAEFGPAMEPSFALCFAGRFSEQLTAAGGNVHWLGQARVRQPLSIWRARRCFRDLLLRQSYDVVVTHSSWSQAIFGPVARAAAMPLVFYLHGATGGRHWLERWARRTLPTWRYVSNSQPPRFPGCTRMCARVVTVLSRHRIASSETDAAKTRAELQTPEDATVIIQVSRIELEGHMPHLEALSLLKKCRVVCWQSAARTFQARHDSGGIKEDALQLGIAERVRFLDERSDVGNCWRQPIFTVSPTSDRFVRHRIYRSALCSAPIVTTALGGACEIVDETCGILVAARRRAVAGGSFTATSRINRFAR